MFDFLRWDVIRLSPRAFYGRSDMFNAAVYFLVVVNAGFST